MTRRGVVLRLRGGSAADLLRTCEVLDEAGCDTLYFEEDFALCAAAAVLTRRARVCCLTTSRNSAAVAAAAETLDYLSDGRFVLGVGPFPADDGPYGAAAAAERVLEEVHDRVPRLPVLVVGSSGARPLMRSLRSVDEAAAWLAAVMA